VFSRSDRWRRVVTTAVCLMMALSVAAASRQQEPRVNSRSPEASDIERALETVEADPNLAAERTIKTLRWKRSNDENGSGLLARLKWIAELIGWIAQSARLLVWAAAAVLAGLLVIYIVRLSRTRGVRIRDQEFVAPTHVRDLDIRPETLPKDIGAAARLLWDSGEHRAALALLYRGMLSRLTHVHHVPIRDSSTEGDCLALAANHLTHVAREYASRLIRVWQRFVYGGEEAQAAIVYVLCDDFAGAFDSPAAVDSPGRRGTP
jgi:hypothetical protein